MSLFLDGNSATYPDVKDYTTVTEDGKSLAISFPMSGLKDGRHTLKYQVSDVAGNISTRTISFLVGSSTEVSTLSVAEDPVVSKATFDLTTSLSGTATVTLNILDAAGNTVYKTDVTSFPYTWNLKDNNGVKVPAGIYRFYGTVVAGNNYGGTPIGQIIVVEPNKKK
jgi:flagellar hook assembly protein FlgD